MGVVSTKRWMMRQLLHAYLKLIQVFVRLINPPFFAGIQPYSDQVRFCLRRDAELKH